MGDCKELCAPSATCTVLIPVCALTKSMASLREIVFVTLATRPQPISRPSAAFVTGKMTLELSCGKALHSQSLTPPRVTSQAVCGEYKAIRFSRQIETMRSFHVLQYFYAITLSCSEFYINRSLTAA